MRDRKRGQGIVEFVLVMPVLLMLTLGLVELGRMLYVYETLQGAATDGARAAVRFSYPLPTNQDVAAAVKTKAQSVDLANPCVNGPVTNPSTANSGYIFITGTTDQTAYNAPGGLNPANPAGCNSVTPARGNVPLKVTVVYLYQPLTPFVSDMFGGGITLSASASMRTEY